MKKILKNVHFKKRKVQKSKSKSRKKISNPFTKLKNTRTSNNKKSISHKILLNFIIAVLLCVSAVGITSYLVANNIIKSKVTDASEQTIVQTGDKLDYIFNTYQNRVKELLHNKEFSNDLEFFIGYDENSNDDAVAITEVKDLLTEIALADENMELHLINVNYSVVMSSMNLLDDDIKALLDSEWVNQAIDSDENSTWFGGKDKIGVTPSEDTSSVNLVSSLNIHSNDYLLIVEVDSNLFNEQLKDVTFGEKESANIVDEDNQIVLSHDAKQINTKNEFPVSTNTDKNVTQKKGQLIFQHQSDVTNWYLTGNVSAKELTKDTNIIFIITLLIIVLSIVLSFFIGKRIAKMVGVPLEKISELMASAQEGDLSVRSDLNTREDEIGALAVSFNDMLDKMSTLMMQTREASTKVFHAASELTNVSQVQSDSAQEIASASEEIAGGAANLTEEAENGNTLAGQISNEVDNVYHNNLEMETYAQNVLKSSNEGIRKMDELVGQTQQGEQMTKTLREKTALLNESTNQISEIMKMLTDISSQTNLLSLNAAIEAARAGEAGKGFGVVADEIRKLSAQSKDSIDRVGEITSDIVTNVNDTLTVLEEADPTFKAQVVKAKETDELLNSVGSQMSEFTDKIEHVSSSINQLRESQETLTLTISQVSATAEESSAISQEVTASTEEQTKVSDTLVTTSDELKRLSEDLQHILDNFKV